MASAQATIRGRFKKGSIVNLFEVDGEHVLRPEGRAFKIETAKDVDGVAEVEFKGLREGQRYIAVGLVDGSYVTARVTGRKASDPSEVLSQPPIGPDRLRLADGSWSDERPKRRDIQNLEVGPGPAQEQVGGDVQQRSATFRGTAHPVDPREKVPYASQEDLPEGTKQSSDTRRRELEDGTVVGGGGQAAPAVVGPQRQEDVPKGTPQRSSTATGTAYVMRTDPVEAQREKESSDGKVKRGEPVRVASEPIDGARPLRGASGAASAKRTEELAQSERDAREAPVAADQPLDELADTSGRDAQGQPVE
jgi:hypothetical protein